jgi:hypothetical protein
MKTLLLTHIFSVSTVLVLISWSGSKFINLHVQYTSRKAKTENDFLGSHIFCNEFGFIKADTDTGWNGAFS